MKELLQQYAAYNIWATQRILDVILALPEEKQLAEVPSSFNSLYRTVLHMWDAESGWWQRMKMEERVVFPGENFKRHYAGTVRQLTSAIKTVGRMGEQCV